MSTSTITIAERRSGVVARTADYVALTKPRIAALVLVTVAAGAFVATWGQPDPLVVLHAMIGTLLVAASGSALNQYIERNSDARMARTISRPLPASRLTGGEVLVFAGVCVISGLVYLAASLNWLTAIIGALTWVMYVLIYTPLKSRSAWNTHVGAIAGAMPVLIGAAATGGSGQPALVLFSILLLWQFPHFMAIAWLYRDEYARAGLKMAPVVDPSGRIAGVQAVLCALALLPLSFFAAWHYPPHDATIFMLAALVLGGGQLACAIAFCLAMNCRTAKLLLRASLIYLPALLLLLIALPLL